MNFRARAVVSLLSLSIALVASSCAGSAPTSARVVASTGGTVSASTFQVLIPPMALATDTEVTLVTAPASGYPALANSRPEVLRMEPEGTVLTTPATVTIRADFIAAAPGDSVTIHQLNDVDGTRWVPLPSTRTPSGDVTVSVTLFAPLAVVVVPAPSGCGIHGTIHWGDGSPVPSAPIQLWQGATMLTMTTSDASGVFAFGDLASGSYRIVLMYECNIDQGVSVTAGAATQVDLALCGPAV